MLVAAACGGGSDNTNPTDIVNKASEAVKRDGMAFHAKGSDGSEVWVDSAGQRYRARKRSGTSLLTAVGSGWSETDYDPQTNEVKTTDKKPANPGRIFDPVILWFEPLSALAYGAEITDLGKTTSNGKTILAVESRTPIGTPGGVTDRFLVGRLELDPSTYLVQAFERRVQLPPGETADPNAVGQVLGTQNVRITYDVSEFVPLSSLASDFFDPSHVQEQVVTQDKSIGQIRDSGITPYWLGEGYEAGASKLALAAVPDGVQVDSAHSQGSFHYGVELAEGGTSGEAVVVRLAKPGAGNFPQPTFPQYAGHLPEGVSDVTVGGRPASLHTSVLTPNALPCPTNSCPQTSAPLFILLQFRLEGADVQVETYARVDESGTDRNGYNTKSGIIQLAEALTPAP